MMPVLFLSASSCSCPRRALVRRLMRTPRPPHAAPSSGPAAAALPSASPLRGPGKLGADVLPEFEDLRWRGRRVTARVPEDGRLELESNGGSSARPVVPAGAVAVYTRDTIIKDNIVANNNSFTHCASTTLHTSSSLLPSSSSSPSTASSSSSGAHASGTAAGSSAAPPQTTSSSSKKFGGGAAAGVAIGAVILIGAAGAAWWWFRRRQRRYPAGVLAGGGGGGVFGEGGAGRETAGVDGALVAHREFLFFDCLSFLLRGPFRGGARRSGCRRTTVCAALGHGPPDLVSAATAHAVVPSAATERSSS
ncbi:hypothetical protein FB451DRAFT_1391542 [Mycena latifolia]|nr:hypothetical protein FB451DRAFT_1391542 [Mycena latifolia]